MQSPFKPAPLPERILDLQCVIQSLTAEIARHAQTAAEAREHFAAGRFTREQADFCIATSAQAAEKAEAAASRLRAEMDALQTALAAEEREALARRIVAAPRFEWVSGMQYLVNGRLYTRLADDDFFGAIVLPPDHLPNLADARTLDALRYLAKVGREASPAEILAALEGGANA